MHSNDSVQYFAFDARHAKTTSSYAQTEVCGVSPSPVYVLDDSMRALMLELERASAAPTSSDEWLRGVCESRKGIPPEKIKSRALLSMQMYSTSNLSVEYANPNSVVPILSAVYRKIIEMCKQISAFSSLCVEDKVALLRGALGAE